MQWRKDRGRTRPLRVNLPTPWDDCFRGRVPLKPVSGSEELREALRVLGSVPSDQLLALEVIWQPEGAGEVLSADELITAYPNLSHL